MCQAGAQAGSTFSTSSVIEAAVSTSPPFRVSIAAASRGRMAWAFNSDSARVSFSTAPGDGSLSPGSPA